MKYYPKQGDIVFMNFSPQAGHEQGGRRPALIVSNDGYNHFTGLAIVCPITNTDNKFPMHVPLEEKTSTSGVILCEHVKSLDLSARNAEFIEKLPDDLLADVMERILLSFDF